MKIIMRKEKSIHAQDVEGAMRLNEVIGVQQRLVVKQIGTGIYRIILPEYSFQFHENSPELVNVTDHEDGITEGCIKAITIMQDEREKIAKANKVLTEANIDLMEQIRGLREESKKLKALAATALAARREAGQIKSKWRRRTSRANQMACKRIYKMFLE